MSKAKTIKKSIVVAAAAGMVITTAFGSVSASQIYDDSTVGISSAFDRYANTLAGNDKSVKSAGDIATATDAQHGDGTADKKTDDSSKSQTDAKKDAGKKSVKYPDFKDKCVAVSDDYVNIRSGEGTDSDVVGIIQNNGIATVVKKGKEWTQVVSGDCTGYIRNDLLLYGDEAGAYAESNCEKKATVTTETLNVRTEADVNSDCITQVGSGESFSILSQDDKWVQIALDDQTSGYVSADYVEYTYDFNTAKTMEQIQAEIEAEQQAEDDQTLDEQDAADDQTDYDTDDDQDSEDDQSTDDSQDADDSQDIDDSQDVDDSQDNSDDQDVDDSQDNSGDQGTDDSQDSSDDQDSGSGDVAAPSGQTGIDLANYATQFVGNPYVYGGSSLTDGADCSGFVMAVYAQFGYSLPHSAGAQSGYGVRVDTSSLEPGDILFYGDSSIEHCAIYIGGGMIVHASTEETGIKISSAFYRTPYCAVRIIGQ